MANAFDPATPHGAHPSLVVGREREQATLRDALESARNGHGRLVLVGGEAGIGKTTLLQLLAQEGVRQGAVVLTGFCYDLTTPPPYGPWIELARRARPAIALAPFPAFLDDTEAVASLGSQERLFREVVACFAAIAAQQPLVLLLEDLHWADQGSLDLLRFVAREIAEHRLLLVVSYRADELTRRHPLYQLLPILTREAGAERFEVPRLDTETTRALISTRYPLAPNAIQRLTIYVQQLTDGNPFFAMEVLRALEHAAVLSDDTSGWRLGELDRIHLSPLVREVIEGRLTQLDATVRYWLELAAVIGNTVPVDLWVTVSGADEAILTETMEQATERHLLEERPGGAAFRFTHALVRETLYDGIVLLRRRSWHRRAAEVLTTGLVTDPDAVAHHFVQARDPRAFEWLIAAADRAEMAYAWRSASERLEQALQVLDQDPERLRERGWLRYRLAWSLRLADTARAEAFMEGAVRDGEAAGDLQLTLNARCRWRAMQSLEGHPNVAESIAIGQQFDDAIRSGRLVESLAPPDWVAPLVPSTELYSDLPIVALHDPTQPLWRGWSTLTHELIVRGEIDPCWSIVDRVAQLWPADDPVIDARLSRFEDRNHWGDISMVLAIRSLLRGERDRARREIDQALRIHTSIGNYVDMTTMVMDQLAFTLRYEPERLAERRRLGTQVVDYAAHLLGALDRGETHAWWRTPLDIVEGTWSAAWHALTQRNWSGHSVFSIGGTAATYLGQLALLRGETEVALDCVSRLLPEGPDTQPTGFWVGGLSTMRLQIAAGLALDAGNSAAALQWLEALDYWTAWGNLRAVDAERWMLWARYDRLVDQHDSAIGHARQAIDSSSEPRQPLHLLAAHRLLGELLTSAGQYDEARAHLAKALDLADVCAAPFERALSLLALAELHISSGNKQPLPHTFAEVRSICVPLDAKPALARLTALEGRQPIRRVQDTGYFEGLTAREVEVLRLVAQGLTDAEVATRLYISRRTVGTHLTSIYTKLGVNSRVEATRVAIQRGLDLA